MDEKRKQDRVELRCAVVLWNPHEGTVIQTETENISCRGFYFLSGSPCAPGDHLEATIQLPWRRRDERKFMSLQCRVEVVRVQQRQHDTFGIGCRFHSYTVLDLSDRFDRLAANGHESSIPAPPDS